MRRAIRRIRFERQRGVAIHYRGEEVGTHRLDLFVEGRLVLELKAVARLSVATFAVMRSYLRAVDSTEGLVLNFAGTTLGIHRVGSEWQSNAT